MSNYQIKQMMKKNKDFKKKRGTNIKADINYIENYDDSLINIANDNLEEFKDLEINERLKLIEIFLNNKEIDECDKLKLLDMVKNEQIKNKNTIIYDRVNKNILRIPLLEINLELNKYIFKEKKNNKNKNSSKK